jgi:Dual specificity phosphatase, catalytic domain
MDFTEIVPERLWIGAAPTKSDLAELKRMHGAELVIMDLTGSQEEKAWCRELGVEYDDRTPMMDDGQPIPLSKLKVVSAVIGDNVGSGKRVILHCLKGRGRSPTCAAAFLIQDGMAVSDAKRTILEKRQVWVGADANSAGSLEDFGKIMEMTRATF